ncbi:hypothetical protein GCM10007424_14040 [Flavobacterium suaedae]|uniref:Uncharacterized protein n=1 Tax=Flavobacterium suaedae TaxID=1767027 RepID=A0ABQ1JQX3_9FLAO|nr:hypothetical protein GCM10007424_14040 [Flavobacterium suaedae]
MSCANVSEEIKTNANSKIFFMLFTYNIRLKVNIKNPPYKYYMEDVKYEEL